MNILNIVFVLVILGFAWYVFSTYVLPKVPEPFKTAIIVILAIALILWLLQLAGVGVPHLRLWR